MSDRIKKVFKLIFVWQEEKEERWLREMAQKGWLLEDYNLGVYTFLKSEPGDYIYKLDYQANQKMDYREYLTIFEDAGWEHVAKFMGWHYFRTKADVDHCPDIYSDSTSKIQKYKGLLRVLLIVFFANFINVINIFSNYNNYSVSSNSVLSVVHFIVMGMIVLLCYAIYRIFKIIRELEKDL